MNTQSPAPASPPKHQPYVPANMKMKEFAQTTRKVAKTLFPRDASTFAAVDEAWTAVGL